MAKGGTAQCYGICFWPWHDDRAPHRHRLRDLQRPEQVYQLVHPDLPGDFLALRSLESLPNNLPQQMTSFVGREKELAELGELLARTRLLTLTGSGG